MHHATLNLTFVLALACVPSTQASTGQLVENRPSPLQITEQHEDFLYAIRMVESGDVYNCPTGRFGEQGPYQFRREVWNQYTRVPFARAKTAYADQVAMEHYEWIAHCLKNRGVTPTAWRIAAAWNGGVEAVISGRVPRAARSYAARVVNLVEDQQTVRRAKTPRFQIRLASVP